jgi:hypothetical protein
MLYLERGEKEENTSFKIEEEENLEKIGEEEKIYPILYSEKNKNLFVKNRATLLDPGSDKETIKKTYEATKFVITTGFNPEAPLIGKEGFGVFTILKTISLSEGDYKLLKSQVESHSEMMRKYTITKDEHPFQKVGDSIDPINAFTNVAKPAFKKNRKRGLFSKPDPEEEEVKEEIKEEVKEEEKKETKEEEETKNEGSNFMSDSTKISLPNLEERIEKLDINSITSSFLSAEDEPELERSRSNSGSGGGLFGRRRRRRDSDPKEKKEPEKATFDKPLNDTLETKFLKDYIMILNSKIFLSLCESSVEETIKIVQESALHTEKFFQMMTMLINQLYFIPSDKDYKQSELYEKISKIIRALSKGKDSRELLSKFVQSVVIDGTSKFFISYHSFSVKALKSSIESQSKQNESLNITLLPDLIQLLTEVDEGILYQKEIFIKVINNVLLLIISCKDVRSLSIDLSIILYRLIFNFSKKPSLNQDREVLSEILNLKYIRILLSKFSSKLPILDNPEKLDYSGGKMRNDVKILVEVIVMLYEIKQNNLDIACAYNFNESIKDLYESKEILDEGTKFEKAAYLEYFDGNQIKKSNIPLGTIETAYPRYKHSFRAKVNFGLLTTPTLSISSKCNFAEGRLVISRDKRGQDVVAEISAANVNTEGNLVTKDKILYLHYPMKSYNISAYEAVNKGIGNGSSDEILPSSFETVEKIKELR